MNEIIKNKPRIGFIGLGKLGKPCAEVIASKDYIVNGFDINPTTSDLINVVKSIKECVEKSDLIFIAVPTPHEKEYDGRVPSMHLPPRDFSYHAVEEVLKEVSIHMDSSKMIILISTVLPGTVREKLIPLVESYNFIYNPYLIAMGSVKWDMVNPEMVMIGNQSGKKDDATVKLINFYQDIMENDPRIIIGTWDECECIKIFYNTFISAKISLVNMIQDVAEIQGNINVDIVTDALANSKMRIMGPQYMKSGMGDGGACHPRDNIALRYLSKKLDLGYDLFYSIMNSREKQAYNLAKKLHKISISKKLPIFIHGKAYKPKVSYIDGSYSILIGHYLSQLGSNYKYIDPLTEDYNVPRSKSVILLAHSSSTTYQYTPNTKSTLDEYYCDFPLGSIIVDPWRKFNLSGYEIIHYGKTR